MVAIDSTWDVNPDAEAVALLAPYKAKVDSIMYRVVGTAEMSMDKGAPESLLSNLVADIIQLSRLDENSTQFQRAPVDLYDLCAQSIERLSTVAARQSVTLALTGEHAEIMGVEQLLKEMIYNLLDNAIKYNVLNGSATLSIHKSGEHVILTVSDTGIGIPYAHQPRVFERFYRVDKSHSKEVGGTGLGLSIVRHAAQYHGARLELKSQPGKGTTITVTF